MPPPHAKCIGILTSGGDCPGLNAAIRGVAKPAISDFHIEVIGIEKGFRGLVDNNARVLHLQDVSGILSLGGTILGTSREKFYKMPLPNGETIDMTQRAVETYNRLGLDCLVVLGGNGTHKGAYQLTKHGLNVIGLPKTIDNDLAETDITFGFNSAVTTAAEAIEKLYSTAEAHLRVMVIELMGHNAGWLALTAGIAGGADIIPGEDSEDRVSSAVARAISQRLDMETRVTVLGHLQRGGIPTPFDRVLATRFGTFAAEMLAAGRYNQMVCMKGADVSSVPLEKVAGRTKLVPLDHPLIRAARRVGTNFGD
ncbi:MAG: ATP-dependent 6-phosphofructokinase [Planctomycetes bacterium]|nr:ATP-dependent 6-phosphofructokinase [Planctomycetota bacterium]